VISAWWLLGAPLLAALVLATGWVRGLVASSLVSIAAAVFGLVQAVRLLLAVQAEQLADWSVAPVRWLALGGGFTVEFGLLLDRASVLLLVIVGVVGLLVQLFSVEYMKEEEGVARYFACLSFFTFSMLGIVVSPNLLQMFVFWELVGLASYLLIGFWYERPAASEASKKALITNRVGDFGFLCGILLVGGLAGTLSFDTLATRWPAVTAAPALLTLAGVLVACGAIGKSAQLPLHVWLPDAMEGPTPVSALIHAATMVAAGVYMLFRTRWLWEVSPDAGAIVAWIGAATSLFGAVTALAQRDIKRVLACSTLSQLGYMVMAVGAGAHVAGLFHLTTHAAFKALLFLGAGSVIHGLHHEQDAWKMGGLLRKLPITAVTFALGAAALSGIWPFSGFYSKDAILLELRVFSPALFTIALVTALLTPFYITRLWIIAFLGKPRASGAAHAHEGGWKITLPLVVLAVLALVAGWAGVVPAFVEPGYHTEHPEGLLAIVLPGLPVVGVLAAWVLYGRTGIRTAEEDPLAIALGSVHTVLEERFMIDGLYERTLLALQARIATAFDRFDQNVVIGALSRGLGQCVVVLSRGIRAFQSGHVGAYLFTFGAGAALLLLVLIAL
jgi:NADH-quinone oxidoreductase subunit L